MAATYEDSVEEDLSCPLCFELFVDPHTPKELDCPHINCLVCLEQIINGWRPTLECPECRAKTVVPPGGVTNLKTNLRIRSLAEKHQSHMKRKRSSGVKPEIDTSGAQICPNHVGEKVHFYCTTCKVTACQACIVLKHEPRSRHNIKDVQEIYAEHEEEIKVIIDKADKDAMKWEKAARDVEDQAENYKVVLMTEELKIDNILASIKQQGQALKDELNSSSAKHLENFEKHREELLQRSQDIHAATADAKKLVDEASCHEYVAKHDKIAADIINMTMLNPEMYKDKYGPPTTLKFTPNAQAFKLGTFDSVLQQNPRKPVPKTAAKPAPKTATKPAPRVAQRPASVTKIPREHEYMTINKPPEADQTSASAFLVQQNRVRKLTLIQEIKDFKREISGIGVGIRGSLAVCSKYQGLVQLYDKDPMTRKYKKQAYYKLPVRAWGPQDVAVSPSGDHLVARMECIEIYDKSGTYKGDINTRTNRDSSGSLGMVCVTVTPNGHIVAGDRDLQNITVHQSTDFVRYDIGIAPDRLTPVRNSEVAIANREQGVCIVDLNTGRKILNIPILKAYGVCYDRQTNCILVGRQDDAHLAEDRGVIDQYSCVTGERIGRIAQGLIHPRAMAFMPGGLLLAVADVNVVKIYNVM